MSDPSQPPEALDYAHVLRQPASQGAAIASLILGICSLFVWLCPFVGRPVAVTGLVLGINAKKKNQGKMAMGGIVLSCIGLVLTLINASIGFYLGATGQHPSVNMIKAISSGE